MRLRTFTDEEIAFVRDNAQRLTTRKLAEAFTERFGQPTGQTMIRRLMARNGINTMHEKRNLPLPVGTERWSDYYKCMMVKVRNMNVSGIKDKKQRDRLRNSQWMLKQNAIWESAHGKQLPKSKVIVFLDGDRTNYNPENLYASDLNVVGTIEKMQMHSEDADIYKTALMWGELFYEMKKVKR